MSMTKEFWQELSSDSSVCISELNDALYAYEKVRVRALKKVAFVSDDKREQFEELLCDLESKMMDIDGLFSELAELTNYVDENLL